jgi:hypothetical protein
MTVPRGADLLAKPLRLATKRIEVLVSDPPTKDKRRPPSPLGHQVVVTAIANTPMA